MDRRIFVERPMRPELIVGSIPRQNPTQVSFTQNDHVIDALAPERANQPLSKAVLPRRGSGNRLSRMPMGAVG